jgi:hypothetical protein
MAMSGTIVFGSAIGLSLLAFWFSFIRAKVALAILVFSVVVIPLVFIFFVDFFVLRGTWLGWCLAYPAQAAIPTASGFYLWNAQSVRTYYKCSARI